MLLQKKHDDVVITMDVPKSLAWKKEYEARKAPDTPSPAKSTTTSPAKSTTTSPAKSTTSPIPMKPTTSPIPVKLVVLPTLNTTSVRPAAAASVQHHKTTTTKTTTLQKTNMTTVDQSISLADAAVQSGNGPFWILLFLALFSLSFLLWVYSKISK